MFGNDDQNNQQHAQNNSDEHAVNEPVADATLDDSVATTGFSPAGSNEPVSTPLVPPSNDDDGDGDDNGQSTTSPTTPGDLLHIKQDALQQLSPLVGHLDQSPEEKFRTTMMMIQASDDQSLLRSAYQTAQQITDDKARAQALLDVINEINYFTQQHNS